MKRDAARRKTVNNNHDDDSGATTMNSDPLAASEAGVRVEAAMVKSGIAVTVRASGVVWFKAPELLSTVMV